MALTDYQANRSGFAWNCLGIFQNKSRLNLITLKLFIHLAFKICRQQKKKYFIVWWYCKNYYIAVAINAPSC